MCHWTGGHFKYVHYTLVNLRTKDKKTLESNIFNVVWQRVRLHLILVFKQIMGGRTDGWRTMYLPAKVKPNKFYLEIT